METPDQTTFSEKFIEGLRKAAVELEELRLQAALGKSEARDMYEETKKKLNNYVHEAKQRMEDAIILAKEKSKNLKTLFEELQVQLALGKADTKDMFEDQTKKIIKTLNEIESQIKKNKTSDVYYSKLQMEIERFRIKLDILKLRYKVNKLEAREEFEEKKSDFLKKLSDVKKRFLKKEEEAENKWEQFRNEISNAYSNLKKEFVR